MWGAFFDHGCRGRRTYGIHERYAFRGDAGRGHSLGLSQHSVRHRHYLEQAGY